MHATSLTSEEIRLEADLSASTWQLLPSRASRFADKPTYHRLLQHADGLLAGCQAKAAGHRSAATEQAETGERGRPEWNLREWFQIASYTLEALPQLPFVRDANGLQLPRVLSIARQIVSMTGGKPSKEHCLLYLSVFQRRHPLLWRELCRVFNTVQLETLAHFACGNLSTNAQPAVISDAARTELFSCLQGLHELSTLDWEQNCSQLVPFENILESDPAGVYPDLDAASKHLYRDAVAELANALERPETWVAEQSLQLAAQRRVEGARPVDLFSHIGYYLIDDGRKELESHASPLSLKLRVRRALQQALNMPTLVVVSLFSSILGSLLILDFAFPDVHGRFLKFSIWLALEIATLHIVGNVVLGFASPLLPRKTLPRLKFEAIPPEQARTGIVVPLLLVNDEQVNTLFASLETQMLRHADIPVDWILLTDLQDSPTRPEREENDPLVVLARDKTIALNNKYRSSSRMPFHLLHRRREFNPDEGVWMGWERKRGKIHNFYDYLTGGRNPLVLLAGESAQLREIKFVVVIDEDSELSRDSIRELIGTISHPLNRARSELESGAGKRGYGIIQPRLCYSPRVLLRWRLFEVLFGSVGTDTHLAPVSDFFQDLTGETIFLGKGICDLQVYGRVLHGRLPENILLSHDIVEGACMRTGFASDVQVQESFPANYLTLCERKHRWLRGDLQNVGWVIPQISGWLGPIIHHRLTFAQRWILFDNIKRGFLEISYLFLFLACWLFCPSHTCRCALTLMFMPLWPLYFNLCFDIVRLLLTGGITWSFLELGWRYLRYAHIKQFFLLTVSAHQAVICLDAIVRTAIRLPKKKHLLEWKSMSQTQTGNRSRHVLSYYLDIMPLTSILILFVVGALKPASLACAIPIAVLWGSPKLALRYMELPKTGVPNTINTFQTPEVRSP